MLYLVLSCKSDQETPALSAFYCFIFEPVFYSMILENIFSKKKLIFFRVRKILRTQVFSGIRSLFILCLN